MTRRTSKDPWPSGQSWTIALLALPLAELEAQGIRFNDAKDDLDTLQFATVLDKEVGCVQLLKRHHAPVDGVEVLVDASVSREQGLAAARRHVKFDSRQIDWLPQNDTYTGPRPSHRYKSQ